MAEIDDQRVRDWVTGYRKLMRGSLSETVHVAGAFIDRDEQPYLTIDDIEALLAERDRAVSGGAVSPENRSNEEADLRAMLDRFPPGEWFTASNSADEDNPWWIFAFDKWDDEDDSKTYPIGAVHCERGEFTAESELAEFVVAARNTIPSLIGERDAALARIAAVEAKLQPSALFDALYDAMYGSVSVNAEEREAVAQVAESLAAALAASPTPTDPEPATCCDMHNRNCEPPSELCCGDCSEQCHGMHDCPRGWTTGHHGNPSECIAPDLSGPGPDSPEPTEETP